MEEADISGGESEVSWELPSGRPIELPAWDPREYFLHCLSNCIGNVVGDWTNVLRVFDDQINGPVSLCYTSMKLRSFPLPQLFRNCSQKEISR